ncbi:hypothetical protein M426DRAFT_321952 [Hypoxylon sp. CI-4A]|nr:hypothetical protein M426DRAFT_321952 [Hypoxylon sp. CI-4A]
MDNSWTLVETTRPSLPFPPISQREPIRTQRLIIRPMREEEDLEAYHQMRLEPETMLGTKLGRPDRDIDESRQALKVFLPSNDSQSFLFGIFLASTGEFLGDGGVHTLESSYSGWPEVGYKLKKAFWGQGYATEFVRGLLDAWWKLPRSHVKLRVASLSVEKSGETEAVEQVFAMADKENIGSQKVLLKLGFTQFLEWTEPHAHEHKRGQLVTLVGYKVSRRVEDNLDA